MTEYVKVKHSVALFSIFHQNLSYGATGCILKNYIYSFRYIIRIKKEANNLVFQNAVLFLLGDRSLLSQILLFDF